MMGVGRLAPGGPGTSRKGASRCGTWNKVMVEPMEDNTPQVLNPQRLQALETWLTATNTKLTQVNGQRKYGGPPEVWNGPTPGAHCEVFISQIPRDAYEDLLIPLFSSVGPLWEFRLMMNFSGQNRGFAYAKYSSSGVAADAVRQLHGHMLEPGFRLSVRRSTEKRDLCIGNLPAATRQEDLLKVLRVLVEGLDRVSLQAGLGIEGVSATATFSSHYTASMAKRILVESFKKKLGLTVSVKWQPSRNSSADKPLPQHKPLSLPASPMKQPRHILSSRPPNVPPPRPARRPSTPPGFCGTMGGPSLLPHLHFSCPSALSNSRQGCEVSAPAPAMLLQDQELFEMKYSHAGPDGFLYFTYTVYIPAIGLPLEGLVMILPGPTASSTLEEARQAAAQQVLQRVHSHQLSQPR